MVDHIKEDKKRKTHHGDDVEAKTVKKHKSEKKKEKKDKKDKKHKKHKKDVEEKDVEEEEEEATEEKKSFTNTEAPSAPIPEGTTYQQSAELSAAPQADVDNFFKENEVVVKDPSNLNFRPLLAFNQISLDPKIQKEIAKFPKPTPIQAASWPYLLNGNDVIGVAETGSGKTFAFGVPAVNNLVTKVSKNNKIQVLVVSPTRELASQTYDSLVVLTEKLDLNCVCLYGGVPKDQQRKDLRNCQIVVATPGRLLDLIEEGACDLSNISYLVLDEADRMLEKGFDEDIKRIIGNTSSENRQTLMFTATWPREVRELASTFMKDPVKVSIGNRDELSANKRITQIVEVVDNFKKERKLMDLLKKYQSGDKKNDKVLIFALYKKEATRIERSLQYNGYKVSAIHGDLSQAQRTSALNDFKKGNSNLLLATDVAARGLDIPNVKVVINLTFPLTVEDYVHRIGRTGRAGQTGIAHTLFTENEKHLAGGLVNVLNGANQPVPEDLIKFGTHTKKKEHSAYGAFYKNVDMDAKPKKITFD